MNLHLDVAPLWLREREALQESQEQREVLDPWVAQDPEV